VIEVLESAFPPGTAESWDAVGLVCGDPCADVRRVLLAVDPVTAVADDAVATHADLLLTHHPLLLRPVHSVAADTPKGRVVHRLVRGGCALYVAHTDADSAAGGVNDALADLLGLIDLRPLVPAQAVRSAVRAAHPDEEVPLHLLPRRGEASGTGLGRVGRLAEPTTLAGLARLVADRLPPVPQGVRVSGDPEASVRTVAVCGGSGDSLFDAVRAAGADAYVTADLRHHPAAEAREHRADGRPFLVDVAHWASEWPWLQRCADLLRARLPGLEVEVSTRRTDPWTFVVTPTAPDDPARGSTP